MLEKINFRRYHTDDAFSDILIVKFPAHGLRFVDFDQSDRLQKLRQVARFGYFRGLTRGEMQPVIVAYARLEQDKPTAEHYPGVDPYTEEGEHLLSANSLMTYTLRRAFSKGHVVYTQGRWDASLEASGRERAIITRLAQENRFYLYTGPDTALPAAQNFHADWFDVAHNFIPVDCCGTISDYVGQHAPRLAFNTAFFLLESADYFSHHSGLGEAFNMWISHGVIMRPPLYRRGTLFERSDGHWWIDFFSLEDVALTLPGGLQLYPVGEHIPKGAQPFVVNAPGKAEVTLYTRYFGVSEYGYVLGYTPKAAGALELTVVDRRVVGWKDDGELAIPQNGLVISFTPGVLSKAEREQFCARLASDFHLNYQFFRPEHTEIQEALQAGPMLVKDGQPWLLNRDIESDEQFWPSRRLPDGRYYMGLVPTDYDLEGLYRRHARTALGVGAQGDLILVMGAGVSRGGGMSDVESQGVSLTELADLLIEAGARTALNLDGGGSAQAYYYGGQALVPGERLGLPQVHFERPIPSIGIFR